MQRICVFLGSNPGTRESYGQAAEALAEVLVDNGLGLVYGGSNVGLMGRLANAVLERGGEVIGVIPEALVRKEVAHEGLTDQHIVASMHDRKALMAQLSDGFVAMPGGIGTLEELFEIFTWAQLGFHRKPFALYNVEGYYDRLTDFLNHISAEGFVMPAHRDMIIVSDNPGEIITRFAVYEPPIVDKWVERRSKL